MQREQSTSCVLKMADSEKDNSSNGKAKTKVSLLDEDFSKDFLSSWKSMSATGGDDMDFNFEPVSKGKKKAFDFGMDMDFSLDDAFGKMSSFKIDMPDLDFSSSPKQSTKSKEKTEEDPAKGNPSEKHDKFNFSFDFNRLDDFRLDVPSTKGGQSRSSEKKSKKNCFESEVLSGQVRNDTRESTQDTMSKGPPVCEDAVLSKSEDLVVGDGKPDIPSVNCASEFTVLTYPIPSKETLISSDKKFADDTLKIDHQSYQEEKILKKSCSPGIGSNVNMISVNEPAQLVDLRMQGESAEVHMSSGKERTMTALNRDDEIQLKKETTPKQPYNHLKGMVSSANIPLVEASTQANVSEEMEISPPDRNQNDGSSEGMTVIGECPPTVALTSDAEYPTADKSKVQCSIEKMKIGDDKKKLGDGGSMGTVKIPLNTGNPSTTRDAKAWSSSARSSAATQKLGLKVSSAPFGSGPTAAKAILLRNKVPGAMNSKLPVIQATHDGGRTEFATFENNEEGSTHVGAVDKSYGFRKDNGRKLDEYPSSCTKKLIKQDSDLEKSEKNAAAHATPRDYDDTVNEKYGDEVSVDTLLHNGKAAKDELPSLEHEKMIKNVKHSGFQISSLTSTEQGAKVGNQGQEKLKDNITRIASVQKLDIGQENKLLCQKIDKKMRALPSIKVTRSTSTDKYSAAPNMQLNAKSLGKFERSTRLQARIKMGSPVSAEKQTPPAPSLKRKESEAADMGLEKLHTPKRASPSESRMSNVSAREIEDEVQAQGKFSEKSGKDGTAEYMSPKFNFDQEADMEALLFSSMVENDANVEKAEACAKELDNICNMLKKKHEEAKELLVRSLVNNNNLLMLNHPIYEEKIRAVQRYASKLMLEDLEVEA